MKNFDGLGLHSVLQQSLKYMKYYQPTPIQAKAIPAALDGRDVLGSAQTGTGKTAAFAIPLVEALLNDERAGALVMTPTRELAKQVMEIIRQLLGPKSKINTAFLIGGDSYAKQNAQLRRRPRLIVGTPGRINDHRERGNLDLDNTRFLVLDEMDRMLDMGFSVQIDRIVKYIPKERQTLMFSATMPKNIMKMADKYLHNPERIKIGSTINIADNIDQKIVRVDDQAKKYDILLNELEQRSGTVLIFVKTKRNADKMAKRLRFEDHKVEAIHGDLKQNKRERVIKAYRSKKFRILVATDVVARGLDVPHIEHVINYDIPQVPEDYIHRIGRTARAGASGEALCMIAPQDGRKWHAIEQMLYPDKHPSKPANDHRKKKRKPLKRNRGKAGAGNSDARRNSRNDQNAYGKKKSGGYKGKRKFAGEKRRDDNQGDQAQGNKRSYKPKRKFADNHNSDGGKPMHKKQTKRSRNYAEDKNAWSQTSRGESSEGKSSNGGGYKGKRKFAGGKAGAYKGGKNANMPAKKGGFKGKKYGGQKGGYNKGGYKGNRAA